MWRSWAALLIEGPFVEVPHPGVRPDLRSPSEAAPEHKAGDEELGTQKTK